MLETSAILGEAVSEGDLSAETLERALAAARERVGSIERRQAELAKELAAARLEEALLARLLAIRHGGVVPHDGADALEVGPGGAGEGRGKHPAAEEVVAILEKEGRPVHISELMRRLRERGVPLPGAGTQANVISHLRRDERVVRPARGMYGLRAWGLQEMAVAAKRKSRSRQSDRRSGRSRRTRKRGEIR
jgi:hypothetical protein